MEIYISKDECTSLVDLIEFNLINIIREDESIENINWLANIMRIYDRAKDLINKKEEQ